MRGVHISDLETDINPQPEYLILATDIIKGTRRITIGQLFGLQQQKLNEPCAHCGSRGKFDVRGNCGACGAPP